MQVRDQVKENQIKNLLIPQNTLYQKIKMRGSWFLLLLISPFVLPIGLLKALWELCTLQPKRALKTFGSNTLGSLGLMLTSLISLFFPSLMKSVAKNIFASHTINLSYEKKILRLKLKYDDDIKNHFDVTQYFVDNIDTIRVQSKSNITDQYLLYFGGQGFSYQQLAEEMRTINYFEECDTLKRNIIAFNYPNNPNSIVDLINAGFLEALILIQEKGWCREDLQKNLQLYGHSLGGAVALQVALLLKQTFHVDIPVHVDRSFSSISDWMAEQVSLGFNIPKKFAKILSSLLLTASGGWEMNSVDACKKLNPKMIHYYNIGHVSDMTVKEHTPTCVDKVKTAIYGSKEGDADPIIGDSATLMHGLEDGSARDIFKGLNIHQHAHLIYPINAGSNLHVSGKAVFHELKSNSDFLMLYKSRVDSHLEEYKQSHFYAR